MQKSNNLTIENVLIKIRDTVIGTNYENNLYLVGGIVRDEVMGIPAKDDIDIVLEGDAAELAEFLYKKGICDHKPVTYPRFGTAMVGINGCCVELVGARKENYDPASRKPSTERGTLKDDVYRRDFTINTLLKNLHTGEVRDITKLGIEDIERGIIRTPLEPITTFNDDPLRMLRAVRFASRFGFEIEPRTYKGICECAHRLSIISGERIRDEFVKIINCENPIIGLDMLRETKLLDEFAPELSAMHGVMQNEFHLYDVWEHSLRALINLPANSRLNLKLAALFHDIGKPQTKTIDEDGRIHFYEHQKLSEAISRKIMQRLKFSNADIDEVSFLVGMHMRVGQYNEQWTNAAIRRLVRESGDHLKDLITLTEVDRLAANTELLIFDLDNFVKHIKSATKKLKGGIKSPLDGKEIIEISGISEGPTIGKLKHLLEEAVIEGELLPEEKEKAAQLIKDALKNKTA